MLASPPPPPPPPQFGIITLQIFWMLSFQSSSSVFIPVKRRAFHSHQEICFLAQQVEYDTPVNHLEDRMFGCGTELSKKRKKTINS
jgi:hypothetical protein